MQRFLKPQPPVSGLTARFAAFSARTARIIAESFERLDLPLPDEGEYVRGQEMQLAFLNRRAVVLRAGIAEQTGVENSAWVEPPLGVLGGDGGRVEVVAALPAEKDWLEARRTRSRMLAEGNHFFDSGLCQMGRLPVSTPRFPGGAPQVVDRGAVRRLSAEDESTRVQLLEEAQLNGTDGQKKRELVLAEGAEVRQAREEFFRPLAAAFAGAKEKGGSFGEFWRLCEDFAAAGKTAPGWNDKEAWEVSESPLKMKDAARAARAYGY